LYTKRFFFALFGVAAVKLQEKTTPAEINWISAYR
jgi:hypothetical protein